VAHASPVAVGAAYEALVRRLGADRSKRGSSR
jgi:hypothetical protein